MPLSTGTSKAAFNKNVKTEVAAGKPVKQAVAIAYAQKRKNKAKDCDDIPSMVSRLVDIIRSL